MDNSEMTWEEFTARQKAGYLSPSQTKNDILRLDLNTVPENLRYMVKVQKDTAVEKWRRGER